MVGRRAGGQTTHLTGATALTSPSVCHRGPL